MSNCSMTDNQEQHYNYSINYSYQQRFSFLQVDPDLLVSDIQSDQLQWSDVVEMLPLDETLKHALKG